MLMEHMGGNWNYKGVYPMEGVSRKLYVLGEPFREILPFHKWNQNSVGGEQDSDDEVHAILEDLVKCKEILTEQMRTKMD